VRQPSTENANFSEKTQISSRKLQNLRTFAENLSQIRAKIARQGEICEKSRFCAKSSNSRKNRAPQDRDFLQRLIRLMHTFAGGHEATGKSRISALLNFYLSFKFRFTVAFFAYMLGYRLTSSLSWYQLPSNY